MKERSIASFESGKNTRSGSAKILDPNLPKIRDQDLAEMPDPHLVKMSDPDLVKYRIRIWPNRTRIWPKYRIWQKFRIRIWPKYRFRFWTKKIGSGSGQNTGSATLFRAGDPGLGRGSHGDESGPALGTHSQLRYGVSVRL